MSTNKRFDRICAIVMAAAIIVTVLFMNGSSLGLQTIVDEDAETYTGNEYFTANDLNGTWDTSSATQITLNGDSASIKGNGAYFSEGSLTIKNGGWYVITGELTEGSIIVDAYKSSKIWIMLNGVTVNCSDDAALMVKKADKVFLTLADGTQNTFSSGDTYSDDALENNRNAAIYSKEDLTINGSGSLTVTAEYKHGIKCNDDLVIAGGIIDITCPQDGLHANDSICLTNMDLTITAGDDAIHCDTMIYCQDGELLITECYEGIEAPQIEIAGGDIVIYASDDGINANGGPEESFGMGGGNMGGGFGGGRDVQGDEQNGQAEMSADAQEVGQSGQMDETEAEEEDEEELPLVHITGGSITIINENGNDADGIDSNGDILIEGGTVLVSLTNTGGNCALDYGSENGGNLYLNGGTVAAAGSSSMLEEVSNDSTQCSMTLVLGEEQAAGSTVVITDASGNAVLEQVIPCSFSALIMTSPDLAEGETYTVSVKAEADSTDITYTQEIAMDSITVSSGSSGFGGMGGGMMGGGMHGGGNMNGGFGGFGGRNRGNTDAGSADAVNADASETDTGDPETEDIAEQSSETSIEDAQALGAGEEPDFSNMSGNVPQMPGGDGQMPGNGQMPDFENMSEGEFPQMPDGDGQMPDGDGQMPGNGQMPGSGEMPNDGQMPDFENMSEGDFAQMRGQGGQGGPGMMDDQHSDAADEETADGKYALSAFGSDTWLLLGISVGVLLLGLGFTIVYRRRG